MESPFTITPRVLAHLGEDLIKNESIALIELVKNSYDANASKCIVDFQFNGDGVLNSISIEDDGDGMSLNTIQSKWLVIGTDNKKKEIEKGSYNGRIPLGEKGIGRLGVHKLGSEISLLTKACDTSGVKVFIDWTKLETSTSVDDFKVIVEEEFNVGSFAGKEHGTKIVIRKLKGEWNRRMMRAVYRDLTSLNSPFSHRNDSFDVSIRSNSNIFEGLPNIDDILEVSMYQARCVIEDNRITDFFYQFRPWASLTRIEGRSVHNLDFQDAFLVRKTEIIQDNGRLKTSVLPFSLSDYKIGRIVIDLVIFERDVSVFSYMNMERKSLNDYLRENGGIRVYRDDMRVYNYGERDNDWLGLDARRIGRAGGSVSNNQVLGSISLSRLDSTDLKEKTNREGFIENEAYRAFADAVTYAIDCILKFRNEDKFNLVTLYKKSKRITEPVVGELGEAIKLLDESLLDDDKKLRIKDCLLRAELQYRNVRDVLIKSANAGLNLGVAVHDMEKQVSLLKHFAKTGDSEKILDIAEHLERVVAGYSVFLTNSECKPTKVSTIVKTVVENLEYRFRVHNIKILSNLNSYETLAMMSKAESIASLTNLIDNSIYWISRSRHEGGMIYIYLTDEIEGYATIAVCDNGPGFKIPVEAALQPFVTDKPLNTGMGLGLHITNEVMTAMKGKLIIMDPYDLQLPTKITDTKSNPTVVALCFPKVN